MKNSSRRPLSPQTVRIGRTTYEKLKELEVSVGWVKFKTPDEKISHLVWLYERERAGKADFPDPGSEP